jgi:hypothetical protein
MAQDLTKIFRQVEDSWGSPVVNEASLKLWVSRTGFGKNQALGYADFLKLCDLLIDASDPMEQTMLNSTERGGGTRERTASRGGRVHFGDRKSRDSGDFGNDGKRYTSSWDHLTYEQFGELPNRKYEPERSNEAFEGTGGDAINNKSIVNKSTLVEDSNWQEEGFDQSSVLLGPTAGGGGMQGSQSVPYLISQRKAAAASLFSYDGDAPEPQTSPAKVSADEMVALVKKQNRENRKRDKRHGPIGHRLFDMTRESVSVEGEHLSYTSQAEVFKRTQDYKEAHELKVKDITQKMKMGNELTTKLSVMLKHIAESKINSIGKEYFTNQYNIAHSRKQEEKTSKLLRDAKAERTVNERRMLVGENKLKLEKQLKERDELANLELSKLKASKQILKRSSMASQGFPGTWRPDPESPEKKGRSRQERRESDLKYSESLKQLHELKEERRGMKTVLSTSTMVVDGGDVFDDAPPGYIASFEGGAATGSEVGSPSLDLSASMRTPGKACFVGDNVVNRPISRGEILPSSMFSAERVYSKEKVTASIAPFGTTAQRLDDRMTPATMLRAIPGSPEDGMTRGGTRDTARTLISSPTPWIA